MQHRTQEQLNKLPDAKRSETNEKHFAKVERFGDTVNGLIAQTSDTPDLESCITDKQLERFGIRASSNYPSNSVYRTR